MVPSECAAFAKNYNLLEVHVDRGLPLAIGIPIQHQSEGTHLHDVARVLADLRCYALVGEKMSAERAGVSDRLVLHLHQAGDSRDQEAVPLVLG